MDLPERQHTTGDRLARPLRRRARRLGGAVGTAFAALVVATAGSAMAAPSSQPALRFAVHFGADPFIDLGAAGPSIGDVRILDDALYRDGRRVGRDGGSCVITNAQRPEASCTVTWRLPRGTITGQWLNQPPPRKVIAITGGTAAYRGARGEAIVREHSTDRGTVRFHLVTRRNHP